MIHGHGAQWGAVAAPAAPAIVELLLVCILISALAMLHFASLVATTIRDLLNFEVPVIHKTVHLGSYIIDPVIRVLDDAASATSHIVAALWSDIEAAFVRVLGLPRLVSNGLHSYANLLWNSRLADVLAGPIGTLAGAAHAAYAVGKVAYDALFDVTQPLPDKLARAISGAVSSAVSAAKSYTDKAVGGVASDLRTATAKLEGEIGGILGSAEAYTDSAVSTLRRAEDAALGTVRDLASAAKTAAEAAVSAAAGALTAAEAYTDQQVVAARAALSGAISSAEGAAEGAASAALAVARAQIDSAIAEARAAAQSAVGAAGGGLTAAEAYADAEIARAVASARAGAASALNAAIENVEGDLGAAATAATGAAAESLSTAQAAIADLRDATAREIAAAEALAASATAGAAGAASAAVDVVKSIAIGVEHDLKELEGPLGLLGAGAAIAAIPGIATLVHAIASEAGLENSSCRQKVKGICGTDPSAWAKLLAGIGVAGLTFGFAEMVAHARSLEPAAIDLANKIKAG